MGKKGKPPRIVDRNGQVLLGACLFGNYLV